jgi:hypothetical protein
MATHSLCIKVIDMITCHPPVCCVRSTAHQAKVRSMCKSATAVAVDTTKEK